MTSGGMPYNAMGPDRGPRPDLALLVAEMTARIDGYRIDSDDATWEASPGDRDDEVILTSQDGATEWRRIRVRLEER